MTPLPDLTWVLCDSFGEPLPGSHIGQKRRLLYSRNRAAEARISFGLHDEAAIAVFEALRNGIPQLRVYLGNDPVPVFSGHWTPMKGSSTIDGEATVDLVFRDAFDRLTYRWMPVFGVTYTALDAGLIAKDIIDDLNNPFPYGAKAFTGIATDSAWIEPTMERDRTYVNKNAAEAIIELTEVINGFDWFPTYLDPRDNASATMRFNVAARPAGTDRTEDVRFEYGTGTLENCQGYTFSTSLPITVYRATGVDPNFDNQEGGRAIPLDRYGVIMQVIALPDVSVNSTLSEHGSALLRDNPAHITDFSPEPALSPLPWRDFWVGDTVRWACDDGAMQEQSDVIVQSLEIGLDDSDNLDELVVGIDPEGAEKYIPPATSTRRYVQQQQDLRRRLAALEK